MRTKLNDRTQALVFVVITYLLSYIQQYFIITQSTIQDAPRTLVLMWTPGLVAIAMSLAVGNGLNDLRLKFSFKNWRTLALAYLVPAISAVLILILLNLTGIAKFEVDPAVVNRHGSLKDVLVNALLLAPTVGMLLAIFSGGGEELGWRGFLHTKLNSLRPNHRDLYIGLIWAIWHVPLILFGDYATSSIPILSAALFTVGATAQSYLMGWLREKSDSFWPAALNHGAHNMWILGISPVFFVANEKTQFFAGESGYFCVTIYVAIAIFIARSRNKSAA